jgi:hypothetical protein
MALILRREIGRKLTIDELDSNFEYVLENAPGGGSEIFGDFYTSSVTNVTSETILKSFKIPANTYKLGELLTSGPSIWANGNVFGESIIRVYWSYDENGLDELVDQISVADYYWGNVFTPLGNNESGFPVGTGISGFTEIISKIETPTTLKYLKLSESGQSAVVETTTIPDITQDVYFTITTENSTLSATSSLYFISSVKNISQFVGL